jgi:hypothetical protein
MTVGAWGGKSVWYGITNCELIAMTQEADACQASNTQPKSPLMTSCS